MKGRGLGLFAALAAALLYCSAAGAALPDVCADLGEEDRARALEILAGSYPYDCCDDTIARCLEQEPVSRLVQRLAANVCRRTGHGQSAEQIERALSRRARSMMPGGVEVEIDLADAPVAGVEDAPVEVTVYACARCPFCSRVVPQLLEAVRSGPLKGKARLWFRTFPIRGHEFSKEAGLAFVAAQRQGRFWEFLLETYGDFDGFCVDALPEMAVRAGMDRAIFEQHYADPATREDLVESKKEGLRNGVDVTPSVFLNRRRFLGDATFEELVDVIEEEYERMRGETCLAP